MQTKSMPMQTKAINDRTVTTLFSVAGNVDWTDDRLHLGAFHKTIQERGSKVLHLWAHDGNPPIAVVDSLREVSRADLPKSIRADYPDATGGCEGVSTFIDSPRGNEILLAIKAGAPLEASFGYDAVKADFTNEGGKKIRNLKEVRLYEISTCQFGANSATLGSKALTTPSASKLRGALRSIKSMDGYDIWSECYDVYGAASAVQAIVMLLDDEADDPAQLAQLIGALRLLVAFIGSEVDGIETMGSQASGMEMASRLVTNIKMQIKAGARHSASDQVMVDAMHSMAVDLGASNCAGSSTSGDKSRADAPVGASLTQLRAQLAYLDFAIKE